MGVTNYQYYPSGKEDAIQLYIQSHERIILLYYMGIQHFTSQSQYRYYFILGVLNIFLSVSKKSLERENEKCLLIVSTAFNARLKKKYYLINVG